MLTGFIARVRALWSGIRRGDAIDAEMQEEFNLHMELRAADLVRRGVAPTEAERKARVEFGGTYHYKQAGRESRGLRWFDALRFSWLDVKLGGRMLRRYPGLTVIAGLAMGVAIAIGAGVLSVIALITDPKLPLDEGERIVGIQVWNTASNNPERRIVTDFAAWKSELRSVQDLGVFRTVVRNMVMSDGSGEPVRAAEMSASGFRVTRIAPLLGRYLVDDDERADAPAVIVIGYSVWHSRFGADSGVVGTTVKLGTVTHSIVGVMPEGFAFPESFSLWIPFRANPLSYKRREGPGVYVFGRLAPGVAVEEANAEVAALGARASKAFPETHGRLRPRLLPYAQSWLELDGPDAVLAIRSMQAIAALLLAVICVNVAILVYARTATRQGEIAVRSALGASRARIVGQLFGEALVLSGIGAVLGFGIVAAVAGQLSELLRRAGMSGQLPFWMTARISGETIGYLVGGAVFAAVIIGVIPALQVTGRRVQARLQSLAGGHATVRLGGTWTALIVAEVAFTMAILPFAAIFTLESVRTFLLKPGIPAEQYLAATLSMDRDPALGPGAEGDRRFRVRFAAAREDLLRRVRAENDVADAAFAEENIGSEPAMWIQVDGAIAAPSSKGQRKEQWRKARAGVVDLGFFAAFGVPLVAGRAFGPADLDTAATAAIVNRAFVDSILHGRNALGRRLRTISIVDGQERPGPWREIVGVVENAPAYALFDVPHAAWYSAARAGQLYSANLAIRVRSGDPAAFAGRLRALAVAVTPSLQLHDVRPLDDLLRRAYFPLRLLALGMIVVTFSVLILSLAGVYSLMSVVVTQRRREIGIRIALGADARQVLTSVFARAIMQVGGGIAIGLAVILVFNKLMQGDLLGYRGGVILPAVSLFMVGTGVLAALGPARRGLRIQPTEALKAE